MLAGQVSEIICTRVTWISWFALDEEDVLAGLLALLLPPLVLLLELPMLFSDPSTRT